MQLNFLQADAIYIVRTKSKAVLKCNYVEMQILNKTYKQWNKASRLTEKKTKYIKSNLFLYKFLLK